MERKKDRGRKKDTKEERKKKRQLCALISYLPAIDETLVFPQNLQ